MTLRLPNRKTVYRMAGVGLISVGAAVAVAWHFWLVPVVERFDPQWSLQFTQHGYWDQVQQRIRRYGWMHDDFDEVGAFGDKAWAEWIIRRAEGGEQISDCSRIGHKDAALQFITCQDPSPPVTGSRVPFAVEKAWMAWWKENREKKQEQWIQEGLVQRGVSVHLPAVREDYEPLLILLGTVSTNRSVKLPDQVPAYVRYNAFRWLRDSGFDPLGYAVSNLTAQTPEVVKQGLYAYSKRLKIYPDVDGAGVLGFGRQPAVPDEAHRPYLFSAPVQRTAYGMMILPVLAGVFLLVLSWREQPPAA